MIEWTLSSVQIWRAVEEELPDLDAQLEAGEFGPLYGSLRERIYRHGRKFTPKETLQRLEATIDACAQEREERRSTWINQPIREAYVQLHRMGRCHSVEAWRDEKLVGGLYGLALGRVFFGESMF